METDEEQLGVTDVELRSYLNQAMWHLHHMVKEDVPLSALKMQAALIDDLLDTHQRATDKPRTHLGSPAHS